MSMLAERKVRQKWSLNPRGNQWSTDQNKFGQKLLEKMGWKNGNGLGPRQDGITEHVKVSYKNDSNGMGFKVTDTQWTEHEDAFSKLLNGLQSTEGVVKLEKQSDKPMSLVEKSEKSKVRVHYHKFTRGKDLSRYSEKDLANVFGRKKLQKEVKQEKITDCDDDALTYGVKTVKGGSMVDYFKKKLPFGENRCAYNVGGNGVLKKVESDGERSTYRFNGDNQNDTFHLMKTESNKKSTETADEFDMERPSFGFGFPTGETVVKSNIDDQSEKQNNLLQGIGFVDNIGNNPAGLGFVHTKNIGEKTKGAKSKDKSSYGSNFVKKEITDSIDLNRRDACNYNKKSGLGFIKSENKTEIKKDIEKYNKTSFGLGFIKSEDKSGSNRTGENYKKLAYNGFVKGKDNSDEANDPNKLKKLPYGVSYVKSKSEEDIKSKSEEDVRSKSEEDLKEKCSAESTNENPVENSASKKKSKKSKILPIDPVESSLINESQLDNDKTDITSKKKKKKKSKITEAAEDNNFENQITTDDAHNKIHNKAGKFDNQNSSDKKKKKKKTVIEEIKFSEDDYMKGTNTSLNKKEDDSGNYTLATSKKTKRKSITGIESTEVKNFVEISSSDHTKNKKIIDSKEPNSITIDKSNIPKKSKKEKKNSVRSQLNELSISDWTTSNKQHVTTDSGDGQNSISTESLKKHKKSKKRKNKSMELCGNDSQPITVDADKQNSFTIEAPKGDVSSKKKKKQKNSPVLQPTDSSISDWSVSTHIENILFSKNCGNHQRETEASVVFTELENEQNEEGTMSPFVLSPRKAHKQDLSAENELEISFGDKSHEISGSTLKNKSKKSKNGKNRKSRDLDSSVEDCPAETITTQVTIENSFGGKKKKSATTNGFNVNKGVEMNLPSETGNTSADEDFAGISCKAVKKLKKKATLPKLVDTEMSSSSVGKSKKGKNCSSNSSSKAKMFEGGFSEALKPRERLQVVDVLQDIIVKEASDVNINFSKKIKKLEQQSPNAIEKVAHATDFDDNDSSETPKKLKKKKAKKDGLFISYLDEVNNPNAEVTKCKSTHEDTPSTKIVSGLTNPAFDPFYEAPIERHTLNTISEGEEVTFSTPVREDGSSEDCLKKKRKKKRKLSPSPQSARGVENMCFDDADDCRVEEIVENVYVVKIKKKKSKDKNKGCYDNPNFSDGSKDGTPNHTANESFETPRKKRKTEPTVGIDNPALNITLDDEIEEDLILNTTIEPIRPPKPIITPKSRPAKKCERKKSVRFSDVNEEFIIAPNEPNEDYVGEELDVNAAITSENKHECLRKTSAPDTGVINGGFEINNKEGRNWYSKNFESQPPSENVGVANPSFSNVTEEVSTIRGKVDDAQAQVENDLNEAKVAVLLGSTGQGLNDHTKTDEGVYLSYRKAMFQANMPSFRNNNPITVAKKAYRHLIKGDILVGFKNCNLHQIQGYAAKRAF